MPSLRKIIDGQHSMYMEFAAPKPTDNEDLEQADPKGMAKHVASNITDPLEQTKEGFEGLTNAKLNYEAQKEKMRRQLLPVQSVIQHVNQLHQLQDQYGTHPVDPNVQNDANMGYQEERQGVPPNMQQTPGMMQQSNPNRNVSYPGAGPKIPTPPMGAQPAQPQSKGVAPKPKGAGQAFPKANKKPGAKAPGPGQGRGITVHVKAATMGAPGAPNPLASTFAAEKVRQMSSKCKMDAEGAKMAHMPTPTMSRTVSAPARMSTTQTGGNVRTRMSAKKKKEEMEAKAPPGWEGTVKHMKKHPEITNPYALSWYMKKKGDTPHHE